MHSLRPFGVHAIRQELHVLLGAGKMIQAPETGGTSRWSRPTPASELARAIQVDPALAAAVAGSI
jgi:hypothetical protein